MRALKGLSKEQKAKIKANPEFLRGVVFNFHTRGGGTVESNFTIHESDCGTLLDMHSWMWHVSVGEDAGEQEPSWPKHNVELMFECQVAGCDCGRETETSSVEGILESGHPMCSADERMEYLGPKLTWPSGK